MVEAVLEPIPKGADEVEEYVAALFQASGHFVEKNIAEDMLELDVVATSYEAGLPAVTMAEAKSGAKWKTRDIFGLLGLMRFLGSAKGVFFVTDDRNKSVVEYNGRFNPFGVTFFPLGDPATVVDRFRDAGFPQPTTPNLLAVMRYTAWAERELIRELYRAAKQDNRQGSKEAVKYYRLVTSGIFFNDDVRASLFELFNAFKDHPRLSLALAREIEGKPFDAHGEEKCNVWTEAMYQCKHLPLQAAWYVEHRARLAILKKAVDYLCLERAGKLPQKFIGGLDLSTTMFNALPVRFKIGLDWLGKQGDFERYPFFWQMFLWGLGGFYLTHRKEEEFAYMAELAGLTPDRVPVALEAFDQLFPVNGTWFRKPHNADICLIMGVPAPLRGIGAYHRLEKHGVKKYEEIGCHDFTLTDLAKWHNHGVELLTKQQV